jgi:hypothetical protein
MELFKRVMKEYQERILHDVIDEWDLTPEQMDAYVSTIDLDNNYIFKKTKLYRIPEYQNRIRMIERLIAKKKIQSRV